MLTWPSICKPFGFLVMYKKFKQSRERWNKVVTKTKTVFISRQNITFNRLSTRPCRRKIVSPLRCVLIVNEVRSGKVRSHFLAFLLYIFNIMVDKTTPASTDREVGTATQDNMFLMKSVFAG